MPEARSEAIHGVAEDQEEKVVLEPADMPEKKEDKAEPEAKKTDDDDDLGEYGEKVQKRIGKERWKRAEVERERDELRRRYEDIESRLKQAEGRSQTNEDAFIAAQEESVKNARARLQRELKDAQEIGDAEKIFDATEKIADARFEMRRIEALKARRPAERKEEPQQREQARPNDRAVSWASENNEWFGKDRTMTGAAYAIDAQLKDEGYNPNTDGYYAELTKRVHEAFPHKFTRRSTVQQTVAGVSRTGAAAKKGTTAALSESQKHMAKRLGVPEAEYAKYLDTV